MFIDNQSFNSVNIIGLQQWSDSEDSARALDHLTHMGISAAIRRMGVKSKGQWEWTPTGVAIEDRLIAQKHIGFDGFMRVMLPTLNPEGKVMVERKAPIDITTIGMRDTTNELTSEPRALALRKFKLMDFDGDGYISMKDVAKHKEAVSKAGGVTDANTT